MSDSVQDTMLATHRDFGDFRDGSVGELLAWLWQIDENVVPLRRHCPVLPRDLETVAANSRRHRLHTETLEYEQRLAMKSALHGTPGRDQQCDLAVIRDKIEGF